MFGFGQLQFRLAGEFGQVLVLLGLVQQPVLDAAGRGARSQTTEPGRLAAMGAILLMLHRSFFGRKKGEARWPYDLNMRQTEPVRAAS
jgi:hypothetical protein